MVIGDGFGVIGDETRVNWVKFGKSVDTFDVSGDEFLMNGGEARSFES